MKDQATTEPVAMKPAHARLPWPRHIHGATWALLGLLAVGLGVICATVGDYGISWDENVQRAYGDAILRYFASGGQDKSYNSIGPLRFYGPTFELPVAAISHLWTNHVYIVRHVATAITALLTVPALVRIGRHLGSRWAGLLGGLALVMMPMFYGHAFVNSKDIPFACLFAWVMALILERFATDHWTWMRTALFGLVLGLMAGTRPGGAVAAAIPLTALFAWGSCFTAPGRPIPWRPRFMRELALAVLIAWVIMVLPWPYAHENPLTHPAEAMAFAMRFPRDFLMLFEGKIIVSTALPRYYLAKYLLITTPPVLLAGAAVGLAAGIREQLRSPRAARSQAIFLLQAWLLLPILLFAIRPPNVYDGIRHFLFLLPALAMLHALGVAWVVSKTTATLARSAIIAGTVLMTLSPAISLARLHPYQMTYFNSFVGGVGGAGARYETDYWLTSFREAMEWVNTQAVREPGRRFTVLLATRPTTLDTVQGFKAANVDVRATPKGTPSGDRLPDDVDYAILSTRTGQTPFRASPVVHTVHRDGAVFCVVRGREVPR